MTDEPNDHFAFYDHQIAGSLTIFEAAQHLAVADILHQGGLMWLVEAIPDKPFPHIPPGHKEYLTECLIEIFLEMTDEQAVDFVDQLACANYNTLLKAIAQRARRQSNDR